MHPLLVSGVVRSLPKADRECGWWQEHALTPPLRSPEPPTMRKAQNLLSELLVLHKRYPTEDWTGFLAPAIENCHAAWHHVLHELQTLSFADSVCISRE